ncbi:MAG: ubiquinol-cytochrome C chaperone family protein [Acetobacteraceae bacterium]
MAGFFGLSRRNRHERTGFQLYNLAVAAARDPFLYLTGGVPDTLDGRFDLIGLHTFLLIHRLTREPEPGPAVAQAIFDAMFSDMDINLREMGVGDMSVGKRVKAMWEAFHGRAAAYTAALDAGDETALTDALARNLWRGAELPAGADAMMCRMVVAQTRTLAGQPLAALARGEARFLPAEEACR